MQLLQEQVEACSLVMSSLRPAHPAHPVHPAIISARLSVCWWNYGCRHCGARLTDRDRSGPWRQTACLGVCKTRLEQLKRRGTKGFMKMCGSILFYVISLY